MRDTHFSSDLQPNIAIEEFLTSSHDDHLHRFLERFAHKRENA